MNNQKIINDNMEKFKVFKPKENENYFYIEVDGEIFENTNLSDNNFNNNVLKRNRVFKTRKHAKQYRDFMDKLKEKSKPFEIAEDNYKLYYNYQDNAVVCFIDRWLEAKDLYFDRKTIIQLINDYPNELKHWYLEVPYED